MAMGDVPAWWTQWQPVVATTMNATWPPMPPASLRYTKLTVTPECVVLEGEHGFPRMEIALDVLRQLLDYATIEAKAVMEALAK